MTAPAETASTAKDQTAEVLGTATAQAGNVASDAKGAAADVAGTAKEQTAHVVGETIEQAKDLTAGLKQQATTQLGNQSEKLTEGMKALSGQLTSGDTSGVVGQVLTEAGRRLQALTDHIERVGPDGLLRDVRSYAKSNPGTFLMGAALAGLVSGRVMKGISAGSSNASGSPQPSALPMGTATGDPLAGVTEPGLGVDAGYVASPYPDATYQPTTGTAATTGITGTYVPSSNGGAL